MYEQAQKLITPAKNICIIPNEHEPESLSAALALFYTLKESGKNVNLIANIIPENLSFLIPPVDFISTPKNFVISIPKQVADVSQIYYEKQADQLKIHLTVDRGQIKKEDVQFYVENAKPDAVITIGIQDFHKELGGRLDSFGFLLGSPLINIDTNPQNARFGQANLLEGDSITEITQELVKHLAPTLDNKQVATCLLTGLSLHYDNFQKPTTASKIFELCAMLMRQGGDRQTIIKYLFTQKPQPTPAVSEKILTI